MAKQNTPNWTEYFQSPDHCPCCGNDKLARDRPLEEDGQATQEVFCEACEYGWTDILTYQLSTVLTDSDEEVEKPKVNTTLNAAASDLLAALEAVVDDGANDSPHVWQQVHEAIDKANS